jgi:hypothetical protein
MTDHRDVYWDELGIAWCAITPQTKVVAQRLEVRLQRQAILAMTGLIVGFPLGAAGLLLGLYTIVGGWESNTWNFVVRGVAIIAVSVIGLVGLSRLAPVTRDIATKSLSDLIDSAVDRARRTLLVSQLGLYGCAVAAVLGLFGVVVRTYLSGLPKLSPAIDLAILAVVAFGLFQCGRHIRVHLEKMLALKHALESVGEPQ